MSDYFNLPFVDPILLYVPLFNKMSLKMVWYGNYDRRDKDDNFEYRDRVAITNSCMFPCPISSFRTFHDCSTSCTTNAGQLNEAG